MRDSKRMACRNVMMALFSCARQWSKSLLKKLKDKWIESIVLYFHFELFQSHFRLVFLLQVKAISMMRQNLIGLENN